MSLLSFRDLFQFARLQLTDWAQRLGTLFRGATSSPLQELAAQTEAARVASHGLRQIEAGGKRLVGQFQAPAEFPAALAAAAGAALTMAPATALAETPDVIAPLLSTLPPTWQVAGGLALFGVPLLRALATPFRKSLQHLVGKNPLLARANDTLGRFDRVLHPHRSVLTLGFAAATFATASPLVAAGFGAASLASMFLSRKLRQPAGMTLRVGAAAAYLLADPSSALVALPAMALSVYDRRTRDRAQDRLMALQSDAGNPLTLEGRRTCEAEAMSVVPPPPSRELPQAWTHEGNDFSPPAHRTSRRSWWHSWHGLALTLAIIKMALRRQATVVGREAVDQAVETIRRREHAPIVPAFLEEGDLILRHWVESWAFLHGMSVRYENMELLHSLPQGALVMYAAANHSSLFPDFMIWGTAPMGRARPLADGGNFHSNPLAAQTGLSSLLDGIGFGFVNRKKREITPSLTANMQKYGIRPVFYLNSGRAPRAWDDQGRLQRPGLFANVVDPKQPEKYAGTSIVHMAQNLARDTSRPVYIVFIEMDGGWRVQGKDRKFPPWLGPHVTGQTMRFRAAGQIVVEPNTNEAGVQAHKATLLEMAQRETGIREFLIREVAHWTKKLTGGRNYFQTCAERDVIFFLIADRIRSVHPNHKERRQFQEALLRLTSMPNPDEGEVQDLLRKVSSFAKEHQYGKFHPWRGFSETREEFLHPQFAQGEGK